MQKSRKNTHRLLIALIIIMTATTLILASCDPGSNTIADPNDLIKGNSSTDTNSSDTNVSVEPTPEGQTEPPKVQELSNITPDQVVLYGACEKDAVITIKNGAEELIINSINGYFIAQIQITTRPSAVLELTAKAPDKEESVVVEATATYNATADRITGSTVSVGKDSMMYLNSGAENYMGENLYTLTKLRDYRNSLNNTINAAQGRGYEGQGNFLFVVIPSATTYNPSIFPDEIADNPSINTRYDQFISTIADSHASVVDMNTIFSNGEHPYEIFRKTDSSLTEYGSYLVYSEIAKFISSSNYPAAAPRSLEDEFTASQVTTIGGNFTDAMGFSKDVITENLTIFKPEFDMKIGYDSTERLKTLNLSDLLKYTSSEDYSFYSTSSSSDNAIGNRFISKTYREELPTGLIYRSSAANSMMDVIAERFNKLLVAQNNDFSINITDGQRYSIDGSSMVDYVIIIVTESDIGRIIK